MDPVTGGLISGGLKLLGGLFGSKKKTTSTVDYVKLRDNAEKAGFNPLTALRNGGAAGFTTTTHPGLASAEVLADAVGSGIDTFYNRKQAESDAERDALQKQVLREELKQLQSNDAVVRDRNFGYSIPHAVTTTGGQNANIQGARPPLSTDPSGDISARPHDGAEQLGIQYPDGLRVAGQVIQPNQDWVDAETVEARYGDVASWAYGLGVITADVGPWIGRKIRDKIEDRKMRSIYRKNYGEKLPKLRPIARGDTHRDFMRKYYPTVYD